MYTNLLTPAAGRSPRGRGASLYRKRCTPGGWA